jgi:hypothetical protein
MLLKGMGTEKPPQKGEGMDTGLSGNDQKRTSSFKMLNDSK